MRWGCKQQNQECEKPYRENNPVSSTNCKQKKKEVREIQGLKDLRDIYINYNVYILLRFSFEQRNEKTTHRFMSLGNLKM